MTWFYERQDAVLVCEVRKATDETTYEFEIAGGQGPTTHRFTSPTDLITTFLHEQSRLKAEGWRPRAGNVESFQ